MSAAFVERLRAHFADGTVTVARNEVVLEVAPAQWHLVCEQLRDTFGFELCMVRACQRIARFYFKESCGQCTPCREGTGWMYRMLTRIVEGKATLDDLQMLRAAAGQIEGHTICAFGEAAAWPVQGFLRHYWDEFEYAIVNKRFLVDDQRAGTVVEKVAA